MPFSSLDLEKNDLSDINVDSLWLIKARDKSGKHQNIYHGNFIPQIPDQLIRRYTQENEIIFEPFMGSGTTLFECERLKRKYIGFDINPVMIDYVKKMMADGSYEKKYQINNCNATNKNEVTVNIKEAGKKLNSEKVHFVLAHPPYMDIVKFTDNEQDLSRINNLQEFLDKLKIVFENSLEFLERNRYFAIVIGDVYKNSEVIPLGFYCMDMIKKAFKVKLKGVVVKNIEGNRGKLGQEGGIWRYRALKSDYFIFKHEYIFVFKKEY